jgi:hypothetical protein
MKKLTAFAILISLVSASAAMASPDRVSHQTITTHSAQKQVVLQQGHVSRQEITRVSPTDLDHSKLADPRLDGNIGGEGAASATGAVNAPGI